MSLQKPFYQIYLFGLIALLLCFYTTDSEAAQPDVPMPLHFEPVGKTAYIHPVQSTDLPGTPSFLMQVDSTSRAISIMKSISPFLDSFWISLYFNLKTENIHQNASFPFLSLAFFQRMQKEEPAATLTAKWIFSPDPATAPSLLFRFQPDAATQIDMKPIPISDPENAHYLEIASRFFHRESLEQTLYLDGQKCVNMRLPFPYETKNILVLLGKLGAYPAPSFTAGFSGCAISHIRIPPTPTAPQNCHDSLRGFTGSLQCSPFISHIAHEVISASRFRLSYSGQSAYPILDITSRNSRAFYQCEIPFSLDTGTYFWQATFCNNSGVWGSWSYPDSFHVSESRPKSMSLSTLSLTDAGKSSPLSLLEIGKEYDLHLTYDFNDTFPRWDTYIIAWLHHEEETRGHYYNKGGPFDPKLNYTINLSFNPRTRNFDLFERTIIGSVDASRLLPGTRGLYIDADTNSSSVNFEKQDLHIRFHLLDSAKTGTWYLTCFGMDPKDNRSNTLVYKISVQAKKSRSNLFLIILLVPLVLIPIIFLVHRRMKSMQERMHTLSNDNNPAFKQISEYVSAHIRDKITVEQAILDLKLNKRAFHALVKKAGLETFIKYVNKQKIDKSKELLMQGKSVLETSYALGFENPGYFIKIFKELENCTPKEYQKQ